MSHAIRALLALTILAAPGAAFAQCTKDSDCKGDRVCERGACVSPGEQAATPPPAQPPPPPPVVSAPPPQPVTRAPQRRAPAIPQGPSEAEWEASARKNVVSYNVLSTVGGFVTASQLQGMFPGLGITQVSFMYERAVSPNMAVFGVLSPNYWTTPGGNNVLYMGATLGWKWYFFGDAPGGFWIGGEVGNLATDIGPGLIAETGYQFLLDFGLQLSIAAGLAISQFGLGPGFAGTIGWNF